MKWFDSLIMATLLVFVTGGYAVSQCSGSSCSGRYNDTSFVTQPDKFYAQISDDPAQVLLYCNDTQIGVFNLEKDYYKPLVNGVFVDPCKPPVELPAKYKSEYLKSLKAEKEKCHCYPCNKDECDKNCPCQKTGKRCDADECTCKQANGEVVGPPQNYGVDTNKLGPKCTQLNGEDCTTEQAFAALVNGTLLDDSAKMHLTVIDADDARRSSIIQQIQADPNSQKFLIQDINPTKPMESWILDCGFKKPTDGTVIYCQAPSGKVLWREDSFDMKRIEVGLRKTDPNYGPKKDPNLDILINPTPEPDPEPNPPVAAGLSNLEIAALGGAALIALYLNKGVKK